MAIMVGILQLRNSEPRCTTLISTLGVKLFHLNNLNSIAFQHLVKSTDKRYRDVEKPALRCNSDVLLFIGTFN